MCGMAVVELFAKRTEFPLVVRDVTPWFLHFEDKEVVVVCSSDVHNDVRKHGCSVQLVLGRVPSRQLQSFRIVEMPVVLHVDDVGRRNAVAEKAREVVRECALGDIPVEESRSDSSTRVIAALTRPSMSLRFM